MTKYRSMITPTPMGSKRFYVYEHAYPQGFVTDDGIDLSDVVFYIGKGTVAALGSTQRVDIHEYEAGGASWNPDFHSSKYNFCTKTGAIHTVWSKGVQVSKRIVFETDDEREALEFELAHIQKNATPYLTNIKRTIDSASPKDRRKKPKGIILPPHIHVVWLNPAYIVNGKMNYKDAYKRMKQLESEGKDGLVPVYIVTPDGKPWEGRGDTREGRGNTIPSKSRITLLDEDQAREYDRINVENALIKNSPHTSSSKAR